MDPKGKTLAVGGEDGTLRFVGAKSASVDDKKVFQAHEGPVLAIALDPKTAHVISGSKGGSLSVWRYASNKVKHELRGHEADITSLVVDSKGKRFASGDAAGHVLVWNLAKGKLLVELELEGAITGLVFIEKGKTLATTAADSVMVTLWDVSKL